MPSTSRPQAAANKTGFAPRLDMTLVAFALAGAAAAMLLPQRLPTEGRYALAISHGQDLRIAGHATPAGPLPDAGARVLSCRRVVSVGPVDFGARCRPGEPATPATGIASAATD